MNAEVKNRPDTLNVLRQPAGCGAESLRDADSKRGKTAAIGRATNDAATDLYQPPGRDGAFCRRALRHPRSRQETDESQLCRRTRPSFSNAAETQWLALASPRSRSFRDGAPPRNFCHRRPLTLPRRDFQASPTCRLSIATRWVLVSTLSASNHPEP